MIWIKIANFGQFGIRHLVEYSGVLPKVYGRNRSSGVSGDSAEAAEAVA
jgi:hypothetical protein